MIETLITSKTRINLLLRLFLNVQSKSYLRQMAKEFNESTNAIRLELIRFEDAGLITGEFVGGKKYFQANHIFSDQQFLDIHLMLFYSLPQSGIRGNLPF